VSKRVCIFRKPVGNYNKILLLLLVLSVLDTAIGPAAICAHLCCVAWQQFNGCSDHYANEAEE
jgi:hypothetical protein